MSAVPTAEAVRRTGKGNAPVWVIRRCPFCRRGHGHEADTSMTEVVLPAGCGHGRFYRLQEVSQ